MKYLTKDWYNKMQASDLHILLKVDERAEEFSEEFFKEIYEIKQKQYIKEQSNLNNLLFKIISHFKNNKQELNYAENFYVDGKLLIMKIQEMERQRAGRKFS